MLKRLLLLAGLLSLATTSAFAAGTVPGFSLTPQFDLTGKAAPGCKLYVIQAGTTSTPQNAYQDTALTQVLPNPLTCDAAARLPQWFVADGTIKLRLTTSTGTQIFAGDSLLVVGPSSGGGGGGGTVDPTTVIATGDVKARYGTGVLSGFVRMNGRTIGSASSGATERANADCQTLFEYLWDADSSLAVSGGRGASAASDWSANKTIALPDGRGYALAGLADMGSSASTIFNGASFTFGTGTTLGAYLGAARRSLSASNMAPYTPSGTVSLAASGGGSATNFFRSNGVVVTGFQGGGAGFDGVQSGTGSLQTITAAFTGTANTGTSAPFDAISPYLLLTFYMKL